MQNVKQIYQLKLAKNNQLLYCTAIFYCLDKIKEVSENKCDITMVYNDQPTNNFSKIMKDDTSEWLSILWFWRDRNQADFNLHSFCLKKGL